MKTPKIRVGGYVSSYGHYWYFIGTIDGEEVTRRDANKFASKEAAKEGLDRWKTKQLTERKPANE